MNRGTAAASGQSDSGLWIDKRLPVLFIAPTVIILLVLAIGPLLFTFGVSLTNWELVSAAPPKFAWLANYIQVLTDARFWNSMKNTLILLVGGVGLQLLFGLITALLLNREFRLKKLVTSLFLIPITIAPVVVGFQWRVIYHESFGPLNYIIRLLHLGNGRAWLADTSTALLSILIAEVWQWTPFVTVVLLAGLQSISPRVYEAANVDGASPMKVFWRVTLPLLKPTIIIVTLFRVMDVFKIFDLVFLLTGGGPGSSSESVSLYTYITGFRYFSMGYATALAVIQLMIVTVISKRLVKMMTPGRA
ncbi:MAG: sugar ABC transporter permease [Clostridia bacterium]|nr:sugar ABC transporter permease [Clostridia bacterium]